MKALIACDSADLGNVQRYDRRLRASGAFAEFERGIGSGLKGGQPWLVYQDGQWRAQIGKGEAQHCPTTGVERAQMNVFDEGKARIDGEQVGAGISDRVAESERADRVKDDAAIATVDRHDQNDISPVAADLHVVGSDFRHRRMSLSWFLSLTRLVRRLLKLNERAA